MTNPSPFQFHQLVPGLDFLQNLMKGAVQAQKDVGHAVPLGNWITPTLSVEELDRRLSELKTVLYWLEQNAHAVKSTIQAMEVQRLTLTTLSTMNVNLKDMAAAFQKTAGADEAASASDGAATAANPLAAFMPFAKPFAKPFAWPGSAQEGDAAPAAPQTVAPEAASPESVTQAPAPAAADQAAGAGADGSDAALADPMGFWGALTQQFQNLAGAALQGAEQAVPTMTGMGQAAQDMVKAAQATAMASATAVTKQARTPAKTSAAKSSAAKTTAKPAAAKKTATAPKPAAKSSSASAKKPPAKAAGSTGSRR